MKYEILADGAYPCLEVALDEGETLVAESGAMAWMDPAIRVKTGTRGGMAAGLKRSFLGGESFFQNEFSTTVSGAKVALVAGQAGEIRALPMEGERLLMERGAYLASSPGVQIDSKFQGLKGLFAEGMFVLQASGTGTMFWNAYGDIQEVQVAGDYLVDNGFAVAWDASLQYNVTKTGKNVRSFLFANALMMRFSGHGRVWVQSRSAQNLASWVYPFRPVKQKS